MRTAFLVLALVACVVPAGTTSADFYLINTLDLSNTNYFGSPLFDNNSPYGTNPSAITTDGTSIWVAGFNGGTGSTAGVVRIDNPWGVPTATGLVSQTTPGSRGYSGLAYDPVSGAVFAAYDNGAASAKGIAAYNVSDNTERWAKNARGGSGVAYDPGFGGIDSGAAWTTFGSGRRALQNAISGVDIYTTSNGMIINDGSGTFWRDMYFAPDGDIWTRRSNGVLYGNRTGGNSCTVSTLVAPQGSADFVNGQNIAYLDGLAGGDLVIYNDRPSTAFGQVWSSCIKLLNADGTPNLTTNFLKGDGTPLDPGFGLGAGYFDFAWDSAGEYLLVADYNNRVVYRFSTIPEPASLLLLGLGTAVCLRRRR